MGGEELKWRQLTHIQLMSPQGTNLIHTVQLKLLIKAQILGRMASIGISNVVITSVYLVKTRLKKLMIMIMNKSQETMVFHGRQKLTSIMKLRLEK